LDPAIEHVHYAADGEEDKAVGPMIISLELPSPQKEERKAILRTKKGNERFIIPAEHCATKKDMLKYVKATFPDTGKIKLTKIIDPELDKRLADAEKKSIATKYKFGVLYVTEGQVEENEMFSNSL
jgi:hypothetical protein